MKQFSKLIILFISLLILSLTSCEKDLYDYDLKQTDKSIIKRVNLRKYNNKPTEIESIQKKLEKKIAKKESNKLVYDSINNFYLDDENAIYILKNGLESYSVAMVKDDNNNIQNLVFNEKPDGTFETLLAIYQMTEEEYKNIDYYSLIQKEVKFYPIEFDQNGLMQFKFANPYAHTTCDIQWTWTEVENDKGDLRDDMPGTHFIWQASFLCTFSGGGGGGGGGDVGGDASTGQTGTNGNNNPNNNENPQGSSGSGGGGVSSGNPNTTGGVYGNGGLDGTGITTTPVVPTAFTSKKIKQDFQAFLQNPNYLDQLNWFNNPINSILVNEIVNYLFENQNYFIEDISPNDFALELIQNSILYTAAFGDNPLNQATYLDFLTEVISPNDNITTTGNETTPPDCASFNFTSLGSSSNWQEAAVQNIHFTVVLLNPQGVFISHVVSNPQPILFGAPKILSVGNTTITPGIAASVSAQALKKSMNETVVKYGNKPVSEMMIQLYFESRLKYNYKQFMPGGRVNIHPQTLSVIPTQYQTSAFGTGNCN